jgi:hypothetical protein
MKSDRREIGRGAMDWVHLTQDKDRWKALMNTVINLQVQQNVGKFLGSRAAGGFSRRTQLRIVCVRLCFLITDFHEMLTECGGRPHSSAFKFSAFI